MPWASPATQPNLPIIVSPNYIQGDSQWHSFLLVLIIYLVSTPSPHLIHPHLCLCIVECLLVSTGASRGHGVDMGKSVDSGHNTIIGLIFGALGFVGFF